MKQIKSVRGLWIGFSVLLLAGVTHAQNHGTSSNSQVGSDQSGRSGVGGQVPGPHMKQSNSSFEKQATDMTGGQTGLAGKYDVVPVRRGALVDEKGGHLDQIVKNKNGETLGTIEKLLKDTKTGKVEYAVLELEGDKYQLPLQWNQLKQEGDHLILNATKTDLRPTINSTLSKDMSPDVSHYMDQINKVRSEPKPKAGDPSAGGTDRPAAAGTLGEDQSAGGGPSGPRALPPGGAPGHEGEHPSSKR
jgi:PRC-barrel domain